jgi:CRISPR system Cascade subunit CasA
MTSCIPKSGASKSQLKADLRVLPKLNFLDEDLLTTISVSSQKSHYSLPGILAALVRGDIFAFASLRSHQRHVWHAFIVQLAALALEKAKEDRLPDDETSWRKLLQALTPMWPVGEPWSLIVPDLQKPAIFQAPVPEGVLPQFRTVETPDGIDVLISSKNHDLKSARMWNAKPEDWLFALVSLQTQHGVMGAGKYGISRMNGGYGSRPLIGWDRPGEPGFSFRHDVAALISSDERIRNPHGLKSDGTALLWLTPWDGVKAVDFRELHPFYIEICRRIRLGVENERVIAMDAPSKAARITGTDTLKGNTGDPWSPVSLEGRSFTVTPEGFSGRKIAELFSPQKFTLPLSTQLSADDGKRANDFIAQSICRGQGRTHGYHERRISIPKSAVALLLENRHEFSQILQRRAEALGDLRLALRFGLFVLCRRGPASGLFDKESTKRFVEPELERFAGAADRRFFDGLWDEVNAQEAERASMFNTWLGVRLAEARHFLSKAPERLPYPSSRRYWVKERAKLAFDEALKRSAHFEILERDNVNDPLAMEADEGQKPVKEKPPANIVEAIQDLLSAKWFSDNQRNELKRYQLGQNGLGDKIALRMLAITGIPIETIPPSEGLRWTWLVHCMALSTHAEERARSSSITCPPGRVFFAAGFSESRVGRLLEAEGEPLQLLFERAVRSVLKTGEVLCWMRIAPLILDDDPESEYGKRARSEIVHDFLTADSRRA